MARLAKSRFLKVFFALTVAFREALVSLRSEWLDNMGAANHTVTFANETSAIRLSLTFWELPGGFGC
jgi:hypothetical protein